GTGRGTADDKEFRWLQKDPDIAVFHQVTAENGPDNDDDADDCKHSSFPPSRVAGTYSRRRAHANPRCIHRLKTEILHDRGGAWRDFRQTAVLARGSGCGRL